MVWVLVGTYLNKLMKISKILKTFNIKKTSNFIFLNFLKFSLLHANFAFLDLSPPSSSCVTFYGNPLTNISSQKLDPPIIKLKNQQVKKKIKIKLMNYERHVFLDPPPPLFPNVFYECP